MLDDIETGTLAEVTALGMLNVCAATSMLDDNSSSVLVDASKELVTASETDSILEATVDISALLDDFETMFDDIGTGTFAEVTALGMLDVCAATSMLDENSSSVLVDASTELVTASKTDSILEATVDISALLDDFETMLDDMETGTLAEVTTLGMLDVCAAISMLGDNSSSVLVDASTELETASETDSILEATVDISALLDDFETMLDDIGTGTLAEVTELGMLDVCAATSMLDENRSSVLVDASTELVTGNEADSILEATVDISALLDDIISEVTYELVTVVVSEVD